MSDVLRHILREQPSWATGPRLTECGNLADLTTTDSREVWSEFVRSECRGSAQRSFATYCVTCCNTVDRYSYRRPGSESTDILARYLTSPGRDKTATARITAELAAISLLIAEHDAAFTETVRALLNTRRIGKQP